MNPRLCQLRELLEQQLYVVDERATAEAIIAAARMHARDGGDRVRQADAERPETGAPAATAAGARAPQLPLTNGSIASLGLPG